MKNITPEKIVSMNVVVYQEKTYLYILTKNGTAYFGLHRDTPIEWIGIPAPLVPKFIREKKK